MNVIHGPKMTYYGSTKGIADAQEDRVTPRLEAFVRESIQNSLDAAIPDTDHVLVEFGTGRFKVDDLSSIFKDLTPVFSINPDNFLYVRDKGTVGLNGGIDDENGNYRGLIKEFSHSGKDQGSQGGSWGK